MPSTYKILHASDLHLSHVPFWYWDTKLKKKQRNPDWLKKSNNFLMNGHDDDVLAAFARFVHRYGPTDPTGQPRPIPLFDHIFITGDLATTGFTDDLERSYQFVTASPGGGPRWLDSKSEPTIGFERASIEAMPGNHDRYKKTVASFPGGNEFDLIFNDLSRPRQFWLAKQGVQRWQVLKNSGRALVIIAADLTLRSSDLGKPPLYGFLGQGRAYKKRIQALELETNHVKADCAALASDLKDQTWNDPVIFWAIHFDPGAPHTLKLLDSHYLIQAANRCRIPALLAGHTHLSMVRPLSLTTTAFICGTTTQAAAKDPFDSSTTANDCQLIEVIVPDVSKDPIQVNVQWFRYQDLQIGPTASISPAGRFVRVGLP